MPIQACGFQIKQAQMIIYKKYEDFIDHSKDWKFYCLEKVAACSPKLT